MTIANTKMPSGFTFQQELLLKALQRQATTGMLMTNPRVTGFHLLQKLCLILLMIRKHQRLAKTYTTI